jgi:hypothetical protein
MNTCNSQWPTVLIVIEHYEHMQQPVGQADAPAAVMLASGDPESQIKRRPTCKSTQIMAAVVVCKSKNSNSETMDKEA